MTVFYDLDEHLREKLSERPVIMSWLLHDSERSIALQINSLRKLEAY